jgi:hypothetical protein
VVVLHLHIVLAAPAFWLGLLAFGLSLNREALEQGVQPCQHALFVTVA